jgi:2-polyprenyl-3-methyl-5-hydroxy-6-metoxy-1,4-benzoquinol methylase
MPNSALYGLRVFNSLGESEPEAVPLTVACPVCGSCDSRERFRLEVLPYAIRQCRTCGLGWMHPPPTEADLSAFYPPDYYGAEGVKFRGLIEWAIRLVGVRRLRFITAHLPPGAAVLDVGCGRGVLLRELADRGYRVYGTERSWEAVCGADPRAEIRCAPTLRDAAFSDNMFDLAIVWHVLEHLPDPRETLQELHRLLKPGGSAIIAVPNFSSWQARWSGAAWFHLDPPRHLFHFSMTALERLLTETGFQVRSRHHFSLRQNPFGWVQSALNRWNAEDRNGLYTWLLRHRLPPEGISRRRRWWYLAAFLLGMPPAVAIEIAAALCRRGATVHVVAAKGPAAPTS